MSNISGEKEGGGRGRGRRTKAHGVCLWLPHGDGDGERLHPLSGLLVSDLLNHLWHT